MESGTHVKSVKITLNIFAVCSVCITQLKHYKLSNRTDVQRKKKLNILGLKPTKAVFTAKLSKFPKSFYLSSKI